MGYPDVVNGQIVRIPTGYSDVVNGRKTDNILAKRKTTERLTMVDRTLH